MLQLLNHSTVLGHSRRVAVQAVQVLQGHAEVLLSGELMYTLSVAPTYCHTFCTRRLLTSAV